MIWKWSEHDYGVNFLRFSDCGKMLFSSGFDNKINIWNVTGNGGIISKLNISYQVVDVVWRNLSDHQHVKYEIITCGNEILKLYLFEPTVGKINEVPLNLKKIRRKFTTLLKVKNSSLILCGTYSGDFLVFDTKFNNFNVVNKPLYSMKEREDLEIKQTDEFYKKIDDSKITHFLEITHPICQNNVISNNLPQYGHHNKTNLPFQYSENLDLVQSGRYLDYRKINDNQFNNLYQKNNFNILAQESNQTNNIRAYQSHNPRASNPHQNKNYNNNKPNNNNLKTSYLIFYSNGKCHEFDIKSNKLNKTEKYNFTSEIQNLIETSKYLITSTKLGKILILSKSTFQIIKEFDCHISKIILMFMIKDIQQFTSLCHEKNHFSFGKDAFQMKRFNPDEILTDKTFQTFSINSQFNNKNHNQVNIQINILINYRIA